MRIIDVFWLVAPEFSRSHFKFSWMDLVAPIAFGGLWLAFFSWQLALRPLLPFNDPNFEEALEHGRRKGH